MVSLFIISCFSHADNKSKVNVVSETKNMNALYIFIMHKDTDILLLRKV